MILGCDLAGIRVDLWVWGRPMRRLLAPDQPMSSKESRSWRTRVPAASAMWYDADYKCLYKNTGRISAIKNRKRMRPEGREGFSGMQMIGRSDPTLEGGARSRPYHLANRLINRTGRAWRTFRKARIWRFGVRPVQRRSIPESGSLEPGKQCRVTS